MTAQEQVEDVIERARRAALAEAQRLVMALTLAKQRPESRF